MANQTVASAKKQQIIAQELEWNTDTSMFLLDNKI